MSETVIVVKITLILLLPQYCVRNGWWKTDANTVRVYCDKHKQTISKCEASHNSQNRQRSGDRLNTSKSIMRQKKKRQREQGQHNQRLVRSDTKYTL